MFPSHENSINKLNERRQNWKVEMQAEVETETLTAEVENKMNRLATATVAADLVRKDENRFYVAAGRKHYTVYQIKDSFLCDCKDNQKFAVCSHAKAAEMYAAKIERENELFLVWCETTAVEPIVRVELDEVENARLDRKFDEEILGIEYAQGEVLDFYSNELSEVYICELCRKPSDTGTEHYLCHQEEEWCSQKQAA